MSSLPKAYFNYATLKARVGNSYKGYEELNCIQVPEFSKTTLERIDEGGSWYSSKKESVTTIYNRFFVIMKNNKPYGVLLEPHRQLHNIASDIHPITKEFYFKEINNFINTLL